MEIKCNNFQVEDTIISFDISKNNEGTFELCGLKIYRIRQNECHVPGTPPNCGLMYNGKGEPGSIAHYNARPGFILIRNSTRTCVNRTWKGEYPKCTYIDMDCDTSRVTKNNIITNRNETYVKYKYTCDKQPQDNKVEQCFGKLHVNLPKREKVSLTHSNITESIEEISDGNLSTCVLVSSGADNLIHWKLELNETRVVSHTVLILHATMMNQPLDLLVRLLSRNKSPTCAKFNALSQPEEDDYQVACFSNEQIEVKYIETIINSWTNFEVELCEMLFYSINVQSAESHMNRSMILILSLSATMTITIIVCVILRCCRPHCLESKSTISRKPVEQINLNGHDKSTSMHSSSHHQIPELYEQTHIYKNIASNAMARNNEMFDKNGYIIQKNPIQIRSSKNIKESNSNTDSSTMNSQTNRNNEQLIEEEHIYEQVIYATTSQNEAELYSEVQVPADYKTFTQTNSESMNKDEYLIPISRNKDGKYFEII